jgi:hypothetical protein
MSPLRILRFTLPCVVPLAGLLACSSGSDDEGSGESNITAGPCVVRDVQQNKNVDAKTLDDPFAKILLANKSGSCPITPDEVLDFMKNKDGAGEPNSVFVVAEDGDKQQGYRFVVSQPTKKGSTTDGPTGPEEMFFSYGGSARGLNPGLNEVIAFSRSKNTYVYYAIENGQWTLQGDGTQVHPGAPPPFRCAQCHPTGALNMKEFEFPWNNWNSSQFDMPVPSASGNVGDLFQRKGGAQDLEGIIAKGDRMYDDARIDAILAGKREGETVRTLISQAMCDVGEVNLSSSRNGRNKRAGKTLAKTIAVPPSSLVDRFLLAPNRFDNGKPQGLATLDLAKGDDFKINLSREDYDAQASKQKLGSASGEDTFFALFGPTRGFVDLQVIETLIKKDVLTSDMVADALMTDFTNAMFSKQRCALAATAPESGKKAEDIRTDWIKNLKASDLPGAVELADRLGDTKDTSKHAGRVQGFLKACADRSAAEPSEFAKDIVTLTDQRRRELEDHLRAIVESPVLFPTGAGKAFSSRLDESTCKLVKQ